MIRPFVTKLADSFVNTPNEWKLVDGPQFVYAERKKVRFTLDIAHILVLDTVQTETNLTEEEMMYLLLNATDFLLSFRTFADSKKAAKDAAKTADISAALD